MLKLALARFHFDNKTHSHYESYHWRTVLLYIDIKLFKKFKYPFVNKKIVDKITPCLSGEDIEKAAPPAANQIAGNHKITLVVH